MDQLAGPVLFKHALISPTCSLETGRVVRFRDYHYETKDPQVAKEIRESKLFGLSISEAVGNPLQRARSIVKRETALEKEIDSLKAKLKSVEIAEKREAAVAAEPAVKEEPKPKRRGRPRKKKEATDGSG